jgi:cold shock CspA family protein
MCRSVSARRVGRSLRSSPLIQVPPLQSADRCALPRGRPQAENGMMPQRQRPSRDRLSGSRAIRGLGFVVGDDGGKDVFVHITVVERSGLATLGEGQRVSMKVVTTPKGREAVSVTLLD